MINNKNTTSFLNLDSYQTDIETIEAYHSSSSAVNVAIRNLADTTNFNSNTVTFYFRLVKSTVFITCPTLHTSGTNSSGGSTPMYFPSCIPVGYRPTYLYTFIIKTYGLGSWNRSLVEVHPSGHITIYLNVSSGSWASTNTARVGPFSISYHV